MIRWTIRVFAVVLLLAGIAGVLVTLRVAGGPGAMSRSGDETGAEAVRAAVEPALRALGLDA